MINAKLLEEQRETNLMVMFHWQRGSPKMFAFVLTGATQDDANVSTINIGMVTVEHADLVDFCQKHTLLGTKEADGKQIPYVVRNDILYGTRPEWPKGHCIHESDEKNIKARQGVIMS